METATRLSTDRPTIDRFGYRGRTAAKTRITVPSPERERVRSGGILCSERLALAVPSLAGGASSERADSDPYAEYEARQIVLARAGGIDFVRRHSGGRNAERVKLRCLQAPAFVVVSIRTTLIAALLLAASGVTTPGAAECPKVDYNRTEAQKRCPLALHTADFERALNLCMDAAQDADAFKQRVSCNPQQYYAVQLDIARWLLDAAYAAREVGAAERAARYATKARALMLGVKNNHYASAQIRKIAAMELLVINDEPLDVRF